MVCLLAENITLQRAGSSPSRALLPKTITMTLSNIEAPATANKPSLPTYDDVITAAWRIGGVAHRTPVLTSRTADERTGARLFFKAENLQRGGAFKFRGAYNAIARLSEDAKTRGVVPFSSGTPAQAIA